MRAYKRKLNELLDQIWKSTSMNDAEFARASGLAYETVRRISYRITKFPRLKTVLALAEAVGFDLELVKQHVKARSA